MAICPEGAITEKQRKIGTAAFGKSKEVYFGQGLLDIGAIQTPAIIEYVKSKIIEDGITVLDVPPGTSCPVIEAIKDSDFVLLVTEPTPFGLNDLELAVDMVRKLGLPFAVAINRSDVGDDGVVQYCQKEDIDVLLEIPNMKKIAEAYSRGTMIVEALPEFEDKFLKLYDNISEKVTVK
jgi:MinD superfamily P-loop ATPase